MLAYKLIGPYCKLQFCVFATLPTFCRIQLPAQISQIGHNLRNASIKIAYIHCLKEVMGYEACSRRQFIDDRIAPKVASGNAGHSTPTEWIKNDSTFRQILRDNTGYALGWNFCMIGVRVISIGILPGGDFSAALAHVARTICRRAEREIIQFYQQSTNSLYHENIEKSVIYLNRLSDYLYILARFINHLNNFPEKEWK